MTGKVCGCCNVYRPYSEFYPAPKRKDGFRSDCKGCTKAKVKDWQSKNKDKCKSWYLGYRDTRYLRKYGVTYVEFLQLAKEQDNKCKICQNPLVFGEPRTKKAAALDHCHATGKVRGILCNVCNTSLGGFQDSPELLRVAAKYLEDLKD